MDTHYVGSYTGRFARLIQINNLPPGPLIIQAGPRGFFEMSIGSVDLAVLAKLRWVERASNMHE